MPVRRIYFGITLLYSISQTMSPVLSEYTEVQTNAFKNIWLRYERQKEY